MHQLLLKSLATIILAFFANRVPIAAAANNSVYPALFAFGDSILDTGNNNNLQTLTKCNFPPYGRDFPGGIATGRFGDGKVFSDLIAGALGIKETLPAYLDRSLQAEDLTTGGVLSLDAQLRMFEDYFQRLQAFVGRQRALYIISNGLYLFSAGNNDIALTYAFTSSRRTLLFPTYANILVGSASNFLTRLYELGARRVWVLSTLPLGCLPGARTTLGGPFRLCAEILNGEAQIFNNMLSSAVSSIRNRLSNYDIRFIDVYDPMLNLIRNPVGSGFINVVSGCCGTGTVEIAALCNSFSFSCPVPSSFFFWDAGHPTQRAYQLTISAILQNKNVSSPPLTSSP
ncbi:SGNH hydrolase superfamily [Sesbania bispinosa]|nr:SGNH hydrolase superfamily [Sesbania bispinosa]